MADEIVESAPSGRTGPADKLRGIWDRVARRWPRWLRPRLPRLRPWQWVAIGIPLLFVVLWTTAAARSTSIYSAHVLVTESRHGIADPNSLFDFGDLPPTAGVDHKITLRNDGSTDTYVMIGVFGGIRDFIDVEDAFFTLGAGEERQILVKLSLPATAEPGKDYSGRVVVTRVPYWVPW